MSASYLHRLRKNCSVELDQLELNISIFLNAVADFEEQMSDNNIQIAVYDDYVGRMMDIIEMVRDCNLKLVEYSSIKNNNIKEHCSPQRAIMSPNYKELAAIPLANVENHNGKENKTSNCVYKMKDVASYDSHKLLKLHVTCLSHSENDNVLAFYARDCQSFNEFEMPALEDIIQYKQYFGLPPMGDIFGLLFKKSIVRAVCMSDHVFLLDSGEVVPLKDINITYHLPKQLQQVPAEAIRCQLEGIQNQGDVPLDELKQCLLELHNQTVLFAIKRKTLNTLHVLLVVDGTTEEHIEVHSLTNPFKTETLQKSPQNAFTPEELEELHEEPLCTSNALKAVLGYIPKDDKRICRFYNPNTNSCFKGNHCRLDHEPLEPDGWTKDVVPAPYALANSYSYLFKNDSIINITVTFINQLEWLYAQVNDPNVSGIPLLWSSDNIPDFKRLKSLPFLYDLVLARYEDDFWYRAKVIDIDEESNHVKIFFVDYGNCQIVPLHDLAQCDRSIAEILYKAVRFRLVTSGKEDISAEQRSNEIAVLRSEILNKTFDVEVVEQIGDDILIRLFK